MGHRITSFWDFFRLVFASLMLMLLPNIVNAQQGGQAMTYNELNSPDQPTEENTASTVKKNKLPYPEDISGVWKNETMVPAFDVGGFVERESTYELTLVQNGEKISGKFLTRVYMSSGVVQKNTRIEGTYKNGKLHLETIDIIRENCYTPPFVSGLYDITFNGNVKREGQSVVLDAKYHFASQRTFTSVGKKLMMGSATYPLRGNVEVKVTRIKQFTTLAQKNAIQSEFDPNFKIEKVKKETPPPPVVDVNPTDSVFENILFQQSVSDLFSEKDSLEVIRLAQVLKNNSNWQVELNGYTESRGSWHDNLKLSQERSNHIKKLLIHHADISPDRIITMGFGPHNPVASNRNETLRKLNRRVEIKIKVK
jgi:outer membrane protein OmpA-like peptidoglycan-associated protein